MEEKNVQAIFQLQDSFVKEFSIDVSKKIEHKSDMNINGQLGFKIDNIREDEKKYIGQIELINDLKLELENEECGKIHIIIIGLFIGEKSEKYSKSNFEDMLKINGATTLSHLVRSYIYTITGLSGMPQISTPMINFVEFFKNAKEVKD